MRINSPDDRDVMIGIPNTYHAFRRSEIRFLTRYFGCETTEDSISAAQRMASLLDFADIHPAEHHNFLQLALYLANLLFSDFSDIKVPLRGRYRTYSSSGRPCKIFFTEEMAQQIRVLCNDGKTRKEAISILKRQNKLPEGKESSLLKRFQEYERRRKQVSDDFAEFAAAEIRTDE